MFNSRSDVISTHKSLLGLILGVYRPFIVACITRVCRLHMRVCSLHAACMMMMMMMMNECALTWRES